MVVVVSSVFCSWRREEDRGSHGVFLEPGLLQVQTMRAERSAPQDLGPPLWLTLISAPG